eukprot:77840_1
MQLIHTLVLFKCMIVVFADKPPPAPGACHKPTLPFASQQAAENYAHYYLHECIYEYYKQDTNYGDGVQGYKAMFGGEGYMYNESTVFQIDNKTMNGYLAHRQKTVFALTVVSLTAPPYDIVVLNWSPYEVFWKSTNNASFNIGPMTWRDSIQVVEASSKLIFFDDSGIVKYLWSDTTRSAAGFAFGRSVSEAALAISEALGYFEDDGSDYGRKYIANPIQFIFISVFCVLTVFVAICVSVFLKCSCSLGHLGAKVVNWNN